MDILAFTAYRILQLCSERRLNLHDLSLLCEIPLSILEDITSGKCRDPRIGTILQICNGLGIRLTEFFDATEYSKTEPLERS